MELTADKGFFVIEVPKPVPTDTQILVRVKYSAIDTSLQNLLDRDMVASYIHDMKSKPLMAGNHFSGTIEAVGASVAAQKEFTVGDGVFGHLQYAPQTKQGAYSEYVTVEADACALKPSNVSWETAASSTTEAMTALQAMRDKAGLIKGKTVLILGSGGGVGSVAVGIAKSLGASRVTAVCSTRDVDRIQKLGADIVIDRKTQDNWETAAVGKFDVVFDAPTKYGLWQASKWLNPGGGFVNTIPTIFDILLIGWLWGWFTGKIFTTVACASKKADLDLVGEWLLKGSVAVEIDSTHDVSSLEAAMRRQNDPSKSGRVAIKVEGGW